MTTEFGSRMRDDVRQSIEQGLGRVEQLESEDIAAVVLYAVTQPQRVNVNILTLYPTEQT
jgi:NADP-dependent 3-hydroxy acid dehydrogenase YdfG